MANYNEVLRTNYFEVTDVDKFQDLIDGLCSNDKISVWKKKFNGKTKFGFGCCSSISYADESCDFSMSDFMNRLAKLLPDGEAVILTEIGHEKLCYIGSGSYIATNKECIYLDLQILAVKRAAEMLGIDNFETTIEY